MSMAELGKIFVSFFKIGLFTFGGGYAMMPLFRQELIEKRKYITEDELIDYYSIGQCTPGVIAVNVATFTGYKIQKVLGATVATLAIVLPSLLIIMVLAGILNTLSDNQMVSYFPMQKCLKIFSSTASVVTSPTMSERWKIHSRRS